MEIPCRWAKKSNPVRQWGATVRAGGWVLSNLPNPLLCQHRTTAFSLSLLQACGLLSNPSIQGRQQPWAESELAPVSKRLSLEGEVGQGPGSCRSVSCPLGDTRMEPWGSVARHRAGCLLSQGNRNANLEPGYEAYSEVGSEAAAPWAPSESSFSTSNGNTELTSTKTNSGHWRLPIYGQP